MFLVSAPGDPNSGGPGPHSDTNLTAFVPKGGSFFMDL